MEEEIPLSQGISLLYIVGADTLKHKHAHIHFALQTFEAYFCKYLAQSYSQPTNSSTI